MAREKAAKAMDDGFRAAIRRLRLANGLRWYDLKALAREHGIGAGGLQSCTENSTRIHLRLLGCWRMCLALGVSLDDALPTGFKPQPRPKDPDGSPQSLMKRLHYLKIMSGLTIAALAARSGLSTGIIGHALYGWGPKRKPRRLALFVAWRMCQALCVSLEDLLSTGIAPGGERTRKRDFLPRPSDRRRQAEALRAKGYSLREIARVMGCCHQAVWQHVRKKRKASTEQPSP